MKKRHFAILLLAILPLLIGTRALAQKYNRYIFTPTQNSSYRAMDRVGPQGKIFAQATSESTVHLIRTEDCGQILWEFEYLPPAPTLSFLEPKDVRTVQDGFIVLGTVYYPIVPPNNAKDYFLLKVDPTGNFLWYRTYDSGFDDEAYDLTLADNGDYLFTGDAERVLSGNLLAHCAFTGRVTPAGVLSWQNVFCKDPGVSLVPWGGRSLVEVPVDGVNTLVYVAVQYLSAPNNNQSDAMLLALNGQAGSHVAHATFRASGGQVPSKLLLTNPGGTPVLTMSGTHYANNSSDAFFLVTDLGANVLSYNSFGTKDRDEGLDIINKTGGGWIMGIRTDSSHQNIWRHSLFELSPFGFPVAARRFSAAFEAQPTYFDVIERPGTGYLTGGGQRLQGSIPPWTQSLVTDLSLTTGCNDTLHKYSRGIIGQNRQTWAIQNFPGAEPGSGTLDTLGLVSVENAFCSDIPCPALKFGGGKLESDLSMGVGPNPTSGVLKVVFEGEHSGGLLEIRDLQGRLVMQREVKENASSAALDLSGRSNGMYLVRFRSDNALIVRKIMLR